MFKLVLTNLLYWCSTGSMTPFFAALFTRKGFTPAETGFLLAVMPLCAIVFQPIWASLADRLGRRKTVVVGLILGAACMMHTITPAVTFAQALVAVIAYAAFFQSILAMSDSLVIQICARDGHDFSHVRLAGAIAYSVVTLLMGFIIDYNSGLQFPIATAFFVMLAFAVGSLPFPWREEPAQRRQPAEDARGAGLDAIFDTPDVRSVLLMAFLGYVALSFVFLYLSRYCTELGYGQDVAGILTSIGGFAEIPLLIFARRVVARFGEVPVLAVSGLSLSLRLVLSATGSLPLLVVGQLLEGFGYMGIYYAASIFVQAHARPGYEARAQGILSGVMIGCGMGITNIAGGLLTNAFGTATAFCILAAVSAAGIVFVWLEFDRKAHRAVV